MSGNTFRTSGGVTYGVSADSFGQALKEASKLAKRLERDNQYGQYIVAIAFDGVEGDWQGTVAAH